MGASIRSRDYRDPRARASTRPRHDVAPRRAGRARGIAAPRGGRIAGLAARGLAALALAALAATATAPRVGAANIPQGKVLRLRIPAPSLHRDDQSVRVYLPPSYDRPDSANRRYPLVIMLHGWPGGDGNWLGQGHAAETLDSMIANRSIPEVIALFPNANSVGILGRSFYLNAHDGSFDIQDFLTRDLVAWADSVYRTRREPADRALVGLSEGGSAAVNLALRNPQVFGACASLSGEFRLSRGFGVKGVLGPEPGATKTLEENSPLHYIDHIVDQAKKQVIYFNCGLDESDWLDQNREFDKKLTALGIPHTYREYPGGHGWGYWKQHLDDALRVVTAGMR